MRPAFAEMEEADAVFLQANTPICVTHAAIRLAEHS
jgi:hypothetical protein